MFEMIVEVRGGHARIESSGRGCGRAVYLSPPAPAVWADRRIASAVHSDRP